MSTKNNLVVVQSNKLVESHYKQEYTIQEQRTILWVISEIHKEDYIYHQSNKLKEIKISAVDYAKLMDIPVSHIYRDAGKIGEALMEKVIKIKEPNKWFLVHWVSSMTYENGIITVKIHPDLIPYLVDIKEKFTSFRLDNILHLNSSHAIKIYQILAQYAFNGKMIVSLEELRSILGILELKAYNSYGAIKRRILEISKREINEKTDLIISYEKIKTGRKVTSIKFKIIKKQTQEEQAKKIFKDYVKKSQNETLKHLLDICLSDEDFFRQNLVIPFFENFLKEKIKNYNPLSTSQLEII